MYSIYLKSRQELCKELVQRLLKRYEYASLLGKHIEGKTYRVTTFGTSISDTREQQCGFVVKIYNGTSFSEYSFSDITNDNIDSLEKDIVEKTKLSVGLKADQLNLRPISDEPLVKDFVREDGGKTYISDEIIAELTKVKDYMHSLSDKVVQAAAGCDSYTVSSLFISKNRELTQTYPWNLLMFFSVARDGSNIKRNYKCVGNASLEECFKEANAIAKEAVEISVELLSATHIEPGVYDIITAPSITGLIAHEAFGHGVEMDMFVKHRARSRKYINKPVASKLISMHDGACAASSVGSYFFDDDGVLAHDTLIIKDGILQTGISDVLSAMQLGTEPTGNGRRQDPSRKAYTRMTNTYFSNGESKLEDMIKSIKYGYMIFDTDNGMEDPKNWNIQCVAAYGREIVDGKFTGKIVSPVVMSGDVIDLLMSITMVGDNFAIEGSGHCGKGYKEWVTVSDGGPSLKCRCKLG